MTTPPVRPPLARSSKTWLVALCLLPAATFGQTFSSLGDATYQTGLVPEDLLVADLNGDGRADVAIADTNAADTGTPDRVSVLMNQGDGTFAPRVDYGVGDRPEGIAGGRFDANSTFDLATANFNSSSVSLLLGISNGTFVPGGTIQVPGGPRAIAAADVNQDGFLDLATANFSGNSVSWLRGNGAGGFSLQSTHAVGRAPESIAIADITGDTIPDLITANTTDDSITVLRGTGGGAFSPHLTVPVGDNPRYVLARDLDGDGMADLLVANHNSGTVSVLRSQGTFFVNQGTLAVSGLKGAVALNLADLNADGRQDLLVSFAQSDRVAIFPGAGGLTFGAGEQLPTGDNPLGIGVGDLDGNGRQDLVVAEALEDQLRVFLSAAGLSPIVLDNGAPGTGFTGSWSVSSSPGAYGASSLFAKSATGTTYTWNVSLPSTSAYGVYVWWTQSSGRSAAVPYSLNHEDGESTFFVDQTTGGGRWSFLGNFAFATNTATLRVRSTSATLSTCADAVCLLPLGQGNAPPNAAIDSVSSQTVPVGTAVSFAGSGFDANGVVASYLWQSNLGGTLSTAQSFTTTGLGPGLHHIVFRVADNLGVWSREAFTTVEVTGSSAGGQAVVIDNGGPGTSFTGSWTVSGAPNPYGPTSLYAKNGATYTYTAVLPAAGAYEVLAWWTQLASRPASAPIEIVHAGGTTTVNVNQQFNGGKWNSLGTFTFGTGGIVRITAVGSPSTCADAVSFVPQGPPPPPSEIIVDNGAPGTSFTGAWTASGGANPYGAGSLYARNGATYSYTMPANGTYRVHLWWTTVASRSSLVPVTIQHAGGTTPLTVNQKVNGGQWNEIGTFSFNGQAIVSLGTSGTTDTTCADAVRLEPQ